MDFNEIEQTVKTHIDDMGYDAAMDHAYQMASATGDVDWLHIFLAIEAR